MAATTRLTKEQVLSIKQMVEDGKTYKEISILLDCQRTTVEKAVYRLRQAGYSVITRRGRPAVNLN